MDASLRWHDHLGVGSGQQVLLWNTDGPPHDHVRSTSPTWLSETATFRKWIWSCPNLWGSLDRKLGI